MILSLPGSKLHRCAKYITLIPSCVVNYTVVRIHIHDNIMDQIHYMLFKGPKRVSLREEDMTTNKIGTIFQVSLEILPWRQTPVGSGLG